MKTTNTRRFCFLSATVALLALSACNTVEGAGEDMKHAGQAVERSADENNNYGH